MNYSPEYKDAILRRMLPPNNESITKIAKEEGLSEQTLRNWRDKASVTGGTKPGRKVTPLLERMLYPTTGAHRINSLLLLKLPVLMKQSLQNTLEKKVCMLNRSRPGEMPA